MQLCANNLPWLDALKIFSGMPNHGRHNGYLMCVRLQFSILKKERRQTMHEIINALKLAGAIVAVVYLFKWLGEYCKHKEAMAAAIDAEVAYQRIVHDIKECPTIHSLKRIERCIPGEIDKIKRMVPDPRKYEILLSWEIASRLIQFGNTYFKKSSQQELIYLLKN